MKPASCSLYAPEVDMHGMSLTPIKELSVKAGMMGNSEKYKPKESTYHFLTGRDPETEKRLVWPYGDPAKADLKHFRLV